MDLIEILESKGIDFRIAGQHHHVRDGWVAVDCPMCGKDSQKFHLGFHLSGRRANCWRCGPFNPSWVLSQVIDLSSRQCAELIGGIERSVEQKEPTKRGKLVIPKQVGPLLPAHERYLLHRGFAIDKILRLWRIQGIGISARLQWRLWIPFYLDSEVVSWTTRAISNMVGVRYVSAKPSEESISHRTLLYGEDYCRDRIVVHEGPTDVWRTGPGAVATCGLIVTREQVTRIARYPKRMICFDNEPAAIGRAQKLANELSAFPGETWIMELDSKDAADASPSEVSKLREFLEN